MTASYLEAAYRRSKLPISVKPTRNYVGVWVGWRDEDGIYTSIAHTWAEATSAYLRLCASLDPATSSPAGNSGGCSANSSTPEGVGM
jgi:hypothetical protein